MKISIKESTLLIEHGVLICSYTIPIDLCNEYLLKRVKQEYIDIKKGQYGKLLLSAVLHKNNHTLQESQIFKFMTMYPSGIYPDIIENEIRRGRYNGIDARRKGHVKRIGRRQDETTI